MPAPIGAYNADFDGDEINLHLKTTTEGYNPDFDGDDLLFLLITAQYIQPRDDDEKDDTGAAG